jgi:hypothetical protein
MRDERARNRAIGACSYSLRESLMQRDGLTFTSKRV